MTERKFNNLFLLFLFFCGAITFNTLIAQRTSKFEGIKTIYNGLTGQVAYDFSVKNKDTILNGNFDFLKSETDSTFENQINGFSITGHFKNGIKEKSWQFSNKVLSPANDIKMEGYHLKYLSNGVENAVDAYFTDGNAHKKWESRKLKIHNSEVTDTLFLSFSNFDNNHFSGDFFAVNPNLRIFGKTDEDGFLHGEWVFDYYGGQNNGVKEIRSFDKGVLIGHIIVKDGNEYEIKHIGLDKSIDDEGDWESIEVDSEFFDVIFQTNFGKKEKEGQSEFTDNIIQHSSSFLRKSIFSYIKINDNYIWSIIDDTKIQLPLLKIKKYPYSSDELVQIKEARENISKAKEIVNNYLKDPQVELNKHAYRELALYYEIYSEYIDEIVKLEKVFDLLSLPSYEFINREEIMPYIFEGLEYPSEVTFEFKDEIKQEKVEFPENLKVEDASIKSLAEHVNEILKMLKAKLEIVEPIIERNRKRFEIEDKEKELLLYRDSIKTLFSNTLEDENFNSLHQRYAETIINYSSNQFKEYAKLPIEKRIEKTDKLLNCLLTFIDSYNQFAILQEQKERIKEEYTRVVWNPFTFTDMEETVKERVYNAYNKDLIPFLLSDLNDNITCNKIELRLQNFTKVYEKMMVLRNQDTKEIERALRRVHDAKKIIEILSLELELN